jgi:general secretion pathway protein F
LEGGGLRRAVGWEATLVSRGELGGASGITLDQLVALNDEMAALVRAGVPLEQGLVELGRELPGRMGAVAARLGQRMSEGETLPGIMASDEATFPPVWRAAVLAGLRSGRLSAALEGMATTGRRVAELRRVVGLSLVYPLIVVALAYVLFVLLVTRLAPITLWVYEDATRSSEPLLSWMAWLGQTAKWWAPWLPAAAVLLLGAWRLRWVRAGLSSRGPGTGRWSTGRPRPWSVIGRTLHDGRMATFAEILALLVQQQMPLPEALVLAADASGDRGLSRAARATSERLARGETRAAWEAAAAGLPPLLGWLIATGGRQAELSQTLRAMAETYRERAARTATWMAIYLPIVLTVLLGGTAVLLQALATFGPIVRLMQGLG